jgi:hypothetical protein
MSTYKISNSLCYFGTVSENIMKELNSEITEIQNSLGIIERQNSKLVGHILNEYSIKKSEKYITDMFNSFDFVEEFSEFVQIEKQNKLKLDSIWVNFQKKREFNPIHNHSGSFSFVIWVKIPYDLNEERKVFSEVLGVNKTSCFEFIYTDIYGKLKNTLLPIDKEWEGKFCVFPSQLNHTVYPFYTSDDYRISVAGNLIFEK